MYATISMTGSETGLTTGGPPPEMTRGTCGLRLNECNYRHREGDGNVCLGTQDSLSLGRTMKRRLKSDQYVKP